MHDPSKPPPPLLIKHTLSLPVTPPLLLPSTPTTTTTTFPHRRRPNRPARTLLLRPRIPKRIPEIPPFGLNRPSRPSRTTRRTRACVLHEAIEAFRGAFGASLYGFGGLGSGEAGGGCEVCFCYLGFSLGIFNEYGRTNWCAIGGECTF